MKQSNKGFTIIEVLIVLAIAGLIMLIIFIAVPKLQRQTRNNQRKREASLLLAAVSECMANRNQQRDRCNEPSEIPIDVATQFKQYTGFHYGTSWPCCSVAYPPSLSEPAWQFAARCNADGSASVGGASANAHVVGFMQELDNGLWLGKCLAN